VLKSLPWGSTGATDIGVLNVVGRAAGRIRVGKSKRYAAFKAIRFGAPQTLPLSQRSDAPWWSF